MGRILCIITLALLLSACDPFHTEFGDVEGAATYRAAALSASDQAPAELLVMDWNIKFAGGRLNFFFDCFGDEVLMKRGQVIAHLEGLAAKINEVNPDIIFLQEIDVDSKRSAYIDQVQWLLDHTALNHGVYASQWKADFIPSDGLGRMNNGNAILSRWPLAGAERVALPQREDLSGLERYFYLKRHILQARVEIPGVGAIELLNTHFSAYAKDGTKKKQIDQLKARLDQLAAGGQRFIGGGDFNALPPGTEQTSDFDDSVCEDEDYIADDYSEEVDWLRPYYDDYSPAIALDRYQASNEDFFTHTVKGEGFWNRKLDYLFTNVGVVDGSGVVHQRGADEVLETMPLSDHAPITVRVLP